MGGHRKLAEDPAHAGIVAQLVDRGQRLRLTDVGGKWVVEALYSHLGARLALPGHIHRRRGVVADEDRGESRWAANHGRELGHLGGYVLAQALGCGTAVDDGGTHRLTSSVSDSKCVMCCRSATRLRI